MATAGGWGTRGRATGRCTRNARCRGRLRVWACSAPSGSPRSTCARPSGSAAGSSRGSWTATATSTSSGDVPRHHGSGLAEQYHELIASLDFKPVVATTVGDALRQVCGLRHEVTFTPDAPVFASAEAGQERDGPRAWPLDRRRRGSQRDPSAASRSPTAWAVPGHALVHPGAQQLVRAASGSSSTRPRASIRGSRDADAGDHEPHARAHLLWPGKPSPSSRYRARPPRRAALRPSGSGQPLPRPGRGDGGARGSSGDGKGPVTRPVRATLFADTTRGRPDGLGSIGARPPRPGRGELARSGRPWAASAAPAELHEGEPRRSALPRAQADRLRVEVLREQLAAVEGALSRSTSGSHAEARRREPTTSPRRLRARSPSSRRRRRAGRAVPPIVGGVATQDEPRRRRAMTIAQPASIVTAVGDSVGVQAAGRPGRRR